MSFLDLPERPSGALSRFAALGINIAECRALVLLAAPVTGLSLVNMGMSVTDTLMTAAFGTEALAAIAVGSDFYSIFFYFAFSCLGGLAPLYAAAHAAEDQGRLACLRSAGWMVALLLAGALGGVIWCAPDILLALGLDPSLVVLGADYTRALALTLVPMLAVGVLRIRLTAIERPGVMLRVTLAMLPLNAVFNYLFMHGVFGVQGMGATGAGVSTLLVACLTLGALIVLSRRHDDTRLAAAGWSEVHEILRIGLPTAIATLAEVGIYLSATLYAATLSVTEAAAHSVAIRVGGVTFAVYVGLQQASMVRLARAEGLPARQREIIASALVVGLLAGAALFLAVVALAGPLADHVLGSSQRAAGISVVLLILLAVSDFAGPGGAVAAGLMRGLKVTRPAMVISLFGHWLLAAPLALILTRVFETGAVGIWIALTAGSLVSSVLTVLALRRYAPDRNGA